MAKLTLMTPEIQPTIRASSYNAAIVMNSDHAFNRGIIHGIGMRLAGLGHFAHFFPPALSPIQLVNVLRCQWIFFHTFGESSEHCEAIKQQAGIRIALLDDLPWTEGQIQVDNVEVGRVAAGHLLTTGLTSFAVVGIDESTWSAGRVKGFGDTLRKAGHATREYGIPHRCEANRLTGHFISVDSSFTDWLMGLPRPCGIFVVNDAWARYTLDCCQTCDIKVTDDMMVIGADDDDLYCDLGSPAISSVRISWHKLGIAAADLAIQFQIETPGKQRVVHVPPEGVAVRYSTSGIHGENREIVAALRYLRTRALKAVSISEILREHPMDRRVFELGCKKILGRTPHQELLRLRIETAKRLLLGTDMRVADIAVQCCIDPRHIAKVFRKQTGMLPEAFRRSLGAPSL